MAAITADSPLAVVAIVVIMLLGASIGITVMALLASEALRIISSRFGDRDTELVESADSPG